MAVRAWWIPREVGAGMALGREKAGGRCSWARSGGLVEFALQVLLGDLHIAQGHGDVFVAQQLHECRKARPRDGASLRHRCG